MKTLYCTDITPDTPGPLDEFFQVTACERKDNKNGKSYLSLKLRDKTGEVDAKYWDVPDNVTAKAGDFVKVRAYPGSYKDALQLKIGIMRVLDRAEVVIEDFLPASKRDRDVMMYALGCIVDQLQHADLKLVLQVMLTDNRHRLRNAPAARALHQGYLGGLLEHILNLCALADGVCKVYPDLNRDVLVAGLIVHDIGKLDEMVYSDSIGYSRTGNLLGHIIQGSILWDKYSGDLDPETRDHVAHIIASHHGILEWGAARVPQTREAMAAHLCDMLDAKLCIMSDALNAHTGEDEFTAKVFALGTPLWKAR